MTFVFGQYRTISVVASIPFMLGWLILGPVMAASIYTAYRDIYFTT